jgi:phosphate transport system permease protein
MAAVQSSSTQAIVARRRLFNLVVSVLSVLATAAGLFLLAWILLDLVIKGIGTISPMLFVTDTRPPGSNGGLANAILGSLLITGVGIAAATPIIIGLFVYEFVVVPSHHASGWAGALALAIIALPIIVRTTQDMLLLVPDALREAAYALGAPKWRVIVVVSYRAAFQGMLTGVLLAVARISGETAPLLFTALSNTGGSTDMSAPMATLPVVIFNYAGSPYPDWKDMAWAGALLITFSVLILNIAARSFAPRRN